MEKKQNSKKILIRVFGLFLVLSMLMFASAELVVQEDADNYRCEGVWEYGSGETCENTYDGDLRTHGTSALSRESTYMYANYNIPSAASRNTAVLKYKTGWGKGTSFKAYCWDNSWRKIVSEACREPESSSADTECDVIIPAACLGVNNILKLKFQLDRPAGTVIEFYEEAIWWEMEVTVEPIPPQPGGFLSLINRIIDWFKNLFSTIFVQQSVIGPQVVEPNTQHTYEIDLSATIPDSDWSDGTYEVQYANWALIDSSGNIKQQGNWEQVNGKYVKSVTITTPSDIGDYALLGMITQFNMTYDSSTGQWVTSEEQIINKEAIDLKTEYTIEEPEVPIPGGFQKFIQIIIDFFKNLWSSIFG